MPINLLLVEADEKIAKFCQDELQKLDMDINTILAKSAEEALSILSGQTSIHGALIDTGRFFLPIVFKADNDILGIKDLIRITFKMIEANEDKGKAISKNNGREIELQVKGKLVHFLYSDVFYAKKEGRKTILVTRKKSFTTPYTLKELKSMIGEDTFVNCHKSFLVNTNNIKKIDEVSYTNLAVKTWNIIFHDANVKPCPLSVNYKKAIEALLPDTDKGKKKK